MIAAHVITDDFAAWLRERISKRGLTHEDAADLIGVSRQTIGAWLKGVKPQSGLADRARERLRDMPSPGPLIEPEQAADIAVGHAFALRKASVQYDPVVAIYEELLQHGKRSTRTARDKLRELRNRWRQQIAAMRSVTFEEMDLQSSTTNSKRSDVLNRVPSLDELTAEVRRLTNVAGGRQQLIAWMKERHHVDVSPSQLSKWLAAPGSARTAYQPSGANALRLFQWVVEQTEVQTTTKDPAPALTGTGRTAQLSKSSHEKTKSNRSKSSRQRRPQSRQKE